MASLFVMRLLLKDIERFSVSEICSFKRHACLIGVIKMMLNGVTNKTANVQIDAKHVHKAQTMTQQQQTVFNLDIVIMYSTNSFVHDKDCFFPSLCSQPNHCASVHLL